MILLEIWSVLNIVWGFNVNGAKHVIEIYDLKDCKKGQTYFWYVADILHSVIYTNVASIRLTFYTPTSSANYVY